MASHNDLELLIDLIGCNQKLLYWCYDTNLQLTCDVDPSDLPFDRLFRHADCWNFVLHTDTANPMILSHACGLMWICVKAVPGSDYPGIHILGPFFMDGIDEEALAALSSRITSESHHNSWGKQVSLAIRQLPSLSVPIANQYAIMLCRVINGCIADVGDIVLQSAITDTAEFSHLKDHTIAKDRIKVYQAEQHLMHNIRTGNIGFASETVADGMPTRIRAYVSDPLKSVQIACTIFTSQCARAAIDGGLSPTLAFALGDAYIKSFFIARTISEAVHIRNDMYKDFVTRVYQTQHSAQYSKVVTSCCQYIDLHVSEEISLELLAGRLGYSKYYLSRLFKEETGMTVNDYAKHVRIERAKSLLATTDQKIELIAVQLHFGSRSFFDKAFKKEVGQTPAEYRAKHLNL